jgi:oligoendopeptidase F
MLTRPGINADNVYSSVEAVYDGPWCTSLEKEGPSMPRALPPRSEIRLEDTWDTASVFPSVDAWSEAFKRVEEALPRVDSFKGRLAENPEILADWIELQSELYLDIGKVYVFANMHYAVDTVDSEAKSKTDRVGALFARLRAASAFSEPEILSIGFPTLRSWLELEPRLAPYEHYFDTIERRHDHVRSAEVEQVLGMVLDPFGTAQDTHSVLADTDLIFATARGTTGEETVPAQGNISALLSDADREIRRTAWESYADAHLAVKHTMANCLSAGVKQDVFFARARNYRSSLDAALHPNNIPTDVFYNLIETFKRHLPTWHRYWRVRREALGYDRLHVYDIKAPLVSHEEKVPYDLALEWITNGMRPLGEEYVDTLRRGATEERWIDIYPNQHKTSGAYSNGWPGTHPFILMSYTDDIFSMSTLAHELGHSMHSYFTRREQPFVYSNYGLFVAEVASNFNQALVRAYLLEHNLDPEFQITLIEEAMSNFHRYFFIMPTLARFELEIHERIEAGGALTADDLMKLMTDLFREGYGDEVEIDEDRIGITWAQFPSHLYANFYVYQYATGISGANALAESVLAGEPGAAARYLEFLKAGGSLFPLDALRLAGVDLTSTEPIERAFGVLVRMIDRLEQLVGQSTAAV